MHLLHKTAQQIGSVAVGVQIQPQGVGGGFTLPQRHVAWHPLVIRGQIVGWVVGGSQHKHKQWFVGGLRRHALAQVLENVVVPHAPDPQVGFGVGLFQRAGIHHFVKALHFENPIQIAPARAGGRDEQGLVTRVFDDFGDGPGNRLAAHITQGERRDGRGEKNGFQRRVGAGLSRVKVAEVASVWEGRGQATQHIKLRRLVEHGLSAPGFHKKEHQVFLGRANG